MHSPDLTANNIDKIAEVFPSVVTESTDENGELRRAVDFDLLRQELSDHIVEGPQERYQLDWPGKRAAAFAANAPIAKTLRPVREESVDFDTTKNIFIEGDNLDALKLLQESYLGKVKLIYIDPPYNTGKDFVYNDDFGSSVEEYLIRSGQTSDDGHRLVSNTEANGRFHSDWLSLIYPRIKLSRNLLRGDGVIMVSINDVEAPRLRQVMDEIFGESNFLGQLVWMKGREGGNDNAGFGQHHEYVVCYAREVALGAAGIVLDPKDTSRHRTSLPEDNLVIAPNMTYREGEPFQLINLSKQKDYTVTIPLADGTAISWPSYAPQTTVDEYVRAGRIFVGKKGVPYVKSFLADEAEGTKPSSLITGESGTTKAGGIEVRELFGSGKVFSYPKPSKLIRRLMQIVGVTKDDIVLDFFAGSGTTAHAVIQANASDGGSRRYIVVQLGEQCEDGSEAAKQGFATIADIAKERVRRAGQGARSLSSDLDVGFRVLRVDTTNMADTMRTPEESEQGQLGLSIDSVKSDRTGEDLLFQVLLDWGLEITLPISSERIAGGHVFVVDDGALIACFDKQVDLDVVRQVATREPLRAVFLDAGFATDDARINAEQIFREVSPSTDVKTI